MSTFNSFRIEWDCRRGMLELDNIIMPFYKQYFETLEEEDKTAFVALLSQTDLQLFSYFFNNEKIPVELEKIVHLIQSKIIN